VGRESRLKTMNGNKAKTESDWRHYAARYPGVGLREARTGTRAGKCDERKTYRRPFHVSVSESGQNKKGKKWDLFQGFSVTLERDAKQAGTIAREQPGVPRKKERVSENCDLVKHTAEKSFESGRADNQQKFRHER